MDIFPLYASGTSQFYVDDVSFEYLPPVLPDLDAAMNAVSVRPLSLVGSELIVSGSVRNTGVNPITSLDITWSDGTSEYTDNISGLNVPSLGYYNYIHSAVYTVAAGDNTFEAWVSNVNGLAQDDNPDNDLKSITVSGLVPAPGKRVVVEEGTGTWCGWCPRGAVFMDQMYDLYPDYFIPIAVHNGDPMTVTEYDDNMGFSAFPTMSIMREEIFGFGTIEAIETRFFDRIVNAPPATLISGAEYNATTGDVLITSQADFSSAVTGTHRIAVVLVEDGVTGTSSGFNQSNYYAGGGSGPMGGYENLPSPVPAAQMVYDHVGRILVGGFFGAPNSVPSPVSAGQVVTFGFDAVNIPADYNTDNMLAVTMLIGPNGTILNANSQTFQELLDTEIVNGTTEKFRNEYAEVYPNPFSDAANVSLNLETPSQVTLRIFNAMGAEVAFRDYGILNGDLVFPLDASNLPAGVYQVHIKMDDYLITKKVVIQR
ncbi:MAG: T9SS type A sorting domain-containing protein [Saprospirales bacterium]|nr:T9SS type A sorting domain-containing protein [Saprospirales bacterium]